MGTNCAVLLAELFLSCYESQDVSKLVTDYSKHNVLHVFNKTLKYLDDYSKLRIYKVQDTCIYPIDVKLSKFNYNSTLFLIYISH